MATDPKPLKETRHYLTPNGYWMACGRVTIEATNYYTRDPLAVTCKGCRRTKMWKRDRKQHAMS